MLPGTAIIALYLLLLAIVGVVGTLRHQFGTSTAALYGVLAISTLFAIAGFGLLTLQRWGWAMSLGATALTLTFGVYEALHTHHFQLLPMVLANLIFFVYLARPAVTQRLR
jgi:uncharacterized membrane protein (DUF2068 family)